MSDFSPLSHARQDMVDTGETPEGLHARLVVIESRLGAIETRLGEIAGLIEAQRSPLDTMERHVHAVERVAQRVPLVGGLLDDTPTWGSIYRMPSLRRLLSSVPHIQSGTADSAP